VDGVLVRTCTDWLQTAGVEHEGAGLNQFCAVQRTILQAPVWSRLFPGDAVFNVPVECLRTVAFPAFVFGGNMLPRTEY
jgi:hypothetical protein